MNQPSQATEVEYGELARALDQFAQRAETAEPAELVALWPGVEYRVLARLRVDKQYGGPVTGGMSSRQLQTEEERARNLAWEIGVSLDLQAVHVGAIHALAKLLRDRGQRFGARGASYGSSAQAQTHSR